MQNDSGLTAITQTNYVDNDHVPTATNDQR